LQSSHGIPARAHSRASARWLVPRDRQSAAKFRARPKFFNLANSGEKRLLAPKNDNLLGDLRARAPLGRPLLHYDSDGRLRCHIAAII
jgi:hypothetical protein